MEYVLEYFIKFCRYFYLGLYTVLTIIPHYFITGIKCIINPKKASSVKHNGKPIISMMMLGLSLSIYFICIFLGSRWYVQSLKLKYLANDIIESTKILEQDGVEEINTDNSNVDNDEYSNVSFLSVDFKDLLAKNKETVGWIKVNNTKVNYSIVQHGDNSYYLKHGFNNNYSIYGWVFGDYRDDFKYFGNNTIIYGHNMLDRTMFGSLVWCLKESWYTNEDNQYIKISTPTSNTVWKIFSIYTIVPEVYYLKTYFNTEEEHQQFVDKIHSRSIYDFGVDVDKDDKILTLQTCTDDGTKRIVIHAKMVKVEYR